MLLHTAMRMARRALGAIAPAGAPHEPRFSKDWFSPHTPIWEQVYAEMRGRPGLVFLEIGVFEGRSTVWLLSHILTHPTSRVVCVDTFEGSVEHRADPRSTAFVDDAIIDDLFARFMHNVRPHRRRVEVRRGRSQEILRMLRPGSFDSVYVDGSHRACDVLEDAVLSFRLLRSGGLMIFDDYDWNQFRGTLDHPKPAIDAFLTLFAGQFHELHRGYQVVIQKV